jgi:hypothetical protein
LQMVMAIRRDQLRRAIPINPGVLSLNGGFVSSSLPRAVLESLVGSRGFTSTDPRHSKDGSLSASSGPAFRRKVLIASMKGSQPSQNE